MTTKKGLKCPQVNTKLTKAELEVLSLITEEFLTVERMSIQRGCSKQAIYKLIKKLKQKVALNPSLKRVENLRCSNQPNEKRLHSQEFNIKILYQDNYYQSKLKKSNLRFLDGHIIRLYRNAIEVYAGEGTSFWGETEQRATAISLKYWQRFFRKLENELKVILIKPRSENIKLVNHHYGNINSKFVEAQEKKGRIRIYANEDGKLWFDMDRSFKFREREHPHPSTGKQDSEIISKHLNDMRDNNPPTNSQLAVHIDNVTKNQEMLAENMK